MPSAVSSAGVAPERDWGLVRACSAVLGVRNPIREITDSIKASPNPAKAIISLAVGDPTVFGLRPPQSALDELARVASSGAHHGYTHSCGQPACRQAVAESHSVPGFPVSENDVFMTSGCSQALQHALAALSRPGCNILLPRPGFPLYKTLCELLGIEARYYHLKANQGWEMDPSEVLGLSDANTIALLVCNPGNPTGHSYSRRHIREVVAAAERARLPIVADEVYEDMAFGGGGFVPMAAESERVPIIHVGALSKKWLVPGWRVGWAVLHDRGDVLRRGRLVEAMEKLSQVTLGPNTLAQAAAPAMIASTAPAFFESTLAVMREGAKACLARCAAIPGLLCPSEPEGGMYLMVQISPEAGFGAADDDVAFARSLLAEESVVVLPGSCFGAPGFFRLVVAAPLPQLHEAWDRIEAHCCRRREEKKAQGVSVQKPAKMVRGEGGKAVSVDL